MSYTFIKRFNIDFISRPFRTFLRLMFHEIREISSVLTPELRRKMLSLRLLMLAVAFMETLTIFVITFFAMSIGSSETIKNSMIFRAIFKILPPLGIWCADNRHFIFFISLVIVFFIAMKNILTAVSHWKTSSFSEKVSQEIGSEIMQRFLYSPYLWHLSGQSRRTFQAMGWRNHLTTMIKSLLMAQSYIVTTFFLFLGLLCVAPGLTLIVYFITGGVGFLTYKLIRLSAARAGEAFASAHSRESSAITNAVQGIREIIIYRQQPAFLKAVSDAAIAGNNPRAYLAISSTIPSWFMEICGFTIVSLTIAVLTHVWHMSIAEITKIAVLLVLVSWRSLPSLNKVVNLMVTIRGVRPLYLPCIDMLKTLRAKAFVVPPPPDPDFMFEKEICLESASFRYPGAKKDCLSDISLTIPKGGLVGFIGASGVGKSTIITMLSGLLDPTSGSMLVDGRRLSPAARAAYCLRVGYVPQHPFFMTGTLAENVAFSEWGRPYDEERVRYACQRAAIDFISPERGGIKMAIGEKLSNISGGQAQRVAIARALYADPDIIIFDEATSSLDQANEKIIHETIMSLRKTTTCIIVSHRLTTIEACDYLYWLDRGMIFAEGAPCDILPRYVDAMKEKTFKKDEMNIGAEEIKIYE